MKYVHMKYVLTYIWLSTSLNLMDISTCVSGSWIGEKDVIALRGQHGELVNRAVTSIVCLCLHWRSASRFSKLSSTPTRARGRIGGASSSARGNVGI